MIQPFIDVILLVGWQDGHQACKNLAAAIAGGSLWNQYSAWTKVAEW